MGEFLSFRKMITPTIIQVIFLLGVVSYGLVALGFMISITASKGFLGFVTGLVGGIIIFALGALMVRIWCELLILLFKIYDELVAIRTGTPPSGQGFPVINPSPATQPAGGAGATM